MCCPERRRQRFLRGADPPRTAGPSSRHKDSIVAWVCCSFGRQWRGRFGLEGGGWASFAIDVANRRRLLTTRTPRETGCGLARPRGFVEDLRRGVQRSRKSSRPRGWGHSPVAMCGLVSWLKDLQPRHEPSSKYGVDLATTMGRRKGCLSPRGSQVHHHVHIHLHLHVRVLLQRPPRAR